MLDADVEITPQRAADQLDHARPLVALVELGANRAQVGDAVGIQVREIVGVGLAVGGLVLLGLATVASVISPGIGEIARLVFPFESVGVRGHGLVVVRVTAGRNQMPDVKRGEGKSERQRKHRRRKCRQRFQRWRSPPFMNLLPRIPRALM